MKKSIIALLALSPMLAPAALFAEETVLFQRMAEMTDPSVTTDTYTYTYDEQGRLSSVLYVGDSRIRYDYEYNDKGQCVKETWNLDYEFRGKYYVTSVSEYEYDDAGRLAISKEYRNTNIINPMSRPELNGIWYNTYDDKGLLTDRGFYVGESKDVPYQLYTYQYNDKGLLEQDDMTSYNYSNEIAGHYRTVYTYDDKGRISEKAYQEATADDLATFKPCKYTFYLYDAEGNIQERFSTGASKNIENKEERLIYTVDESVPADRVIYPVVKSIGGVYEEEHYGMLVNQLVGMDEWRVDNAGVLQLMHAWEYDYDEVSGPVGINTVSAAAVMALRGAEVCGDELCLIGVEKVANLVITDLNGRIVKNIFGAGNRVNISDLAAGVYLVATEAGAAKFVR